MLQPIHATGMRVDSAIENRRDGLIHDIDVGAKRWCFTEVLALYLL
jgi:hypothetical protein